MFFTIMPYIQEWTNQSIFIPSLSIGLNKSAFVVSEDLFIQVSIEQTMSETEGDKFTICYFDNKEEAKNWILSL